MPLCQPKRQPYAPIILVIKRIIQYNFESMKRIINQISNRFITTTGGVGKQNNPLPDEPYTQIDKILTTSLRGGVS